MVVVKNWPANAGDIREAGLIPGLGRFPWRRKWQPAPVFLPGEAHRQRSLVGYIAQRVAKSQTWLKWLSMHTRHWRDISIHHNYSRFFLLTGKIFPGICIGFRWQLCQFWVSFTWHRMGRKKSKQQNLDGLKQQNCKPYNSGSHKSKTKSFIRAGSRYERSSGGTSLTCPGFSQWLAILAVHRLGITVSILMWPSLCLFFQGSWSYRNASISERLEIIEEFNNTFLLC